VLSPERGEPDLNHEGFDEIEYYCCGARPVQYRFSRGRDDVLERSPVTASRFETLTIAALAGWRRQVLNLQRLYLRSVQVWNLPGSMTQTMVEQHD